MHCNAINGNDVVQKIEAAERFELAAFFLKPSTVVRDYQGFGAASDSRIYI